MKTYILRVAVGLLTFIIGWAISTVNFNSSCGRAIPHSRPLSAWDLLLSVENRDLSKIEGEPKAQLDTAIESLRGKVNNRFLGARLFSRISANNGEQRYVLIEESPLMTIPGNSGLQISLFTPGGELINTSGFDAGWRIGLGKIRFIQVTDIGEVLEVESYPVINGADKAWQYYAIVGDKMRLIRLEDSARALTPNGYIFPNHTIGDTQTGRSAEDWQKSLESNDVAEVLATLTWLGGHHRDIKEGGEPATWHEELSEARIVAAVRRRPAAKAAVKALENSDNAWVRDAARAAAVVMH